MIIEKQRMKRVLFFIVFVLSIQFVAAQSPSLKTTVDRTQILIGEPIKYNVEATFPVNSYYVRWFNVPDSFNHFEVVIRGKIDTVEQNGFFICRQTLTLTSFDSGLNTIPALPITFDPATNDQTISLLTDSIRINVSFSPMDSTETFHDIKTIIDVKDEIPWWMWAIGAVLLLLIIFFVIRLIKNLRSRKKMQPLFNSKLTPYEEAMQSLAMLQKEALLHKGESKNFHTRLTEIFKRYLSRKTEKNILNLTSSDVLVLLNDTLLSKIDTALVAGALRMTDAVKFAKYSPPVTESERALADTKKVIEQIEKLIFTDHNPSTT